MTTFINNENRARLKDAIEKPIPRIDASAGTEWPPSILGATPRRPPSTPPLSFEMRSALAKGGDVVGLK
jgi:hypothetical protein